MQNLLRFHGAHAKRIHEIYPKALVTVGAWSEFTLTNNETFGGFNFYKDEFNLNGKIIDLPNNPNLLTELQVFTNYELYRRLNPSFNYSITTFTINIISIF